MPTIAPISELRNYGQVLEKVKPNSPVYLTKNGHGQFSVHSIEDDEEYERVCDRFDEYLDELDFEDMPEWWSQKKNRL